MPIAGIVILNRLSMENKTLCNIKILRWIARILSLIIVGFFLFMFIGETFGSHHSGTSKPISSFEIFQLTLMGLGLLGLLAAWIWELYGGILSFIAFVVIIIIHPTTIASPLIIYPANAVLFMIVWWMKYHHRNDEAVI